MQTRMRPSSSLIAVVQISVCITALISPVASAQCPTCPGDMNGDSNRAGGDIQKFAECVLAGSIPSGNCLCSDMNDSGTIDAIDDVSLFVETLLSALPACPQLPSLNLASGLAVVPQYTVGMAVSLSEPAPTGGVTIQFASSNSSVATIAPSVFIAEGLTTPANNPTVAGVSLGTTQILATAQGYQSNSQAVSVASNALIISPTDLNVKVGAGNSISLHVTSPAPAGGILISLATANPQIASVPPAITIPEGQYSRLVTVNGAGLGTTTLTATATGLNVATANVHVVDLPVLALDNALVGRNLQVKVSGNLGTAAPPPLIMTITSGDPSKVLLATFYTNAGSASITPTTPTSNGVPQFPIFFAYALADKGIVPITATAPGYAAGSATITLRPSGITWSKANISTTTIANDSVLGALTNPLDPVTLNVLQCPECTYQGIRGGFSASAIVTSSNTAVGILSNPASVGFGANNSTDTINFNPISAGTTTLTIGTSFGLNTSPQRQMTATVGSPYFLVADYVIGHNLQVAASGYLGPHPAVTNRTVTITSSNPSALRLATSPTAAGTTSITRTVPAGSSIVPTYYVQSLTPFGWGEFTLSSPGYTSATSFVTFQPSGISWDVEELSSSPLSPNTSVPFSVRYLDPVTGEACASCDPQQIRGGYGPVEVYVWSSNESVGAPVSDTIIINSGATGGAAQFDPATPGTTNLELECFDIDLAVDYQPVAATVTTPSANVSDVTVGRDFQTPGSASLEFAPASPVTVTITSSNEAVATLSTNPASAGSASVTVNNVTTTTLPNFYVQGRSMGTATLTIQAPGYNNGSATVTVNPSGFRWGQTTLNTTAAAPLNTNLTVFAAVLDPVTLTVCESCAAQSIRGGLGTVTVNLTNTNPVVGPLLTNPVIFTSGQSSGITEFDSLTAGTTFLAIETPTGFDAPANFQQIEATVTSNNIIVGNVIVGRDLQSAIFTCRLASTPQVPVTVTFTSSDPAIFTLSTLAATPGSPIVVFPNHTTWNLGIPPVRVHGISIGTATVTVQADGYIDGTATVTVNPSGFIWDYSSVSTSLDWGDLNLNVNPRWLDPVTLHPGPNDQPLRAGLDPVMVNLISSDPSVGTFESPIFFRPGQFVDVIAEFDPVSFGSTNLTIQTPPGFHTPSNMQQIEATVHLP